MTEKQPPLNEVLSLVGEIALLSATCDNTVDNFFDLYLGEEISALVLKRIKDGNARIEFLIDLARKSENDEEVCLALTATLKSLQILRQNRNVVVHACYVIPVDAENFEWIKSHNKEAQKLQGFKISIDMLRSLRDNFRKMNGALAYSLSAFAHEQGFEVVGDGVQIFRPRLAYALPEPFLALPPDAIEHRLSYITRGPRCS